MNLLKREPDPHLTIFVVDDEPTLLELAEAILAPLGFNVQTFRNPALALKAFEKKHPAVLITDYEMGGMTGMDLLCECRRRNPGQKVLLVSGTVDEQDFCDAPMQPDQFIVKPYNVENFRDCVCSLAAACTPPQTNPRPNPLRTPSTSTQLKQ